jgi:putative inorganic carbon (HCO3(-)) transporter
MLELAFGDLLARWRSRPSSARLTEVAIVGLGIAAAYLIGRTAAARGVEAVLWVLVPLGAILLLARPVLGMFLLIATLPLEDLVVFGDGISLTRLLGMGVFVIWLLVRMHRRESWKPLLRSGLFWAGLGLLGWILVSSLWASDASLALAGAFSILNLFLFALLVADQANSWFRIAWVAKALVLTGFLAAALTLQQYFLEGARRAGRGVAGGVNATAYILVIIMPFAFYLIRGHESRLWRLVGFLYIPAALVGVAVTFSRTSFLFLALALLLQLWEVIREGRGWGWLMLLGVVVLVVFLAVSTERIVERAETIFPYLESSLTGEEFDEGAMADRGFLYRVGWAIFVDYPLLGVGYGNFGPAYAVYQYQVPGAKGYWSNMGAHSAYLSLLTGLGLLGLVLLLVLLGVGLRSLTTSWPALRQTRDSSQFLLVQAITYSILLQIGYGFARPVQREKSLWLLLGLAVVVRRLAEQSRQEYVTSDSSHTVSLSAPGAG